MKKLYIVLLITFLLCSCTTNNITKTTNEDTEISTIKETPINFIVEKVTLSQGYQMLNPHVEMLKNEDKASLLVTLGIVECSQIIVDKVTSLDNEINIYISKVGKRKENKLVVPQLIINLEKIDINELKNKKFNIISTNYEPLKISYNVNQALNNIYAQYKVDVNTTPHVKLIKENDKLYWDITLHNIYTRDILGVPLANLTAKVDTETGEIIDVNKELISEYIDEGEILHVSKNNLIFYKQVVKEEKDLYESLWMYDGIERKKLYTTHNQIFTIKYNSKYKTVALIEHDEGISNIFLIYLKDNTVQKITPIDYNHIWLIKWDNEKLLFVNNSKKNMSTFFEYNLTTRKTQKLFSINKNISSFDSTDNLFVTNQFDDDKENTDIYVTKEGINLSTIDIGSRSSFLNKDNIVYLKKDTETGKNFLWLYNINTSERKMITDFDIIEYYIYDKDCIVTICKNNNTSEFSVYKHTIGKDIITTKIAQTISKKVYCNNKNYIYINVIPPTKKEKEYNIYKIDLSKISLQ